MARTRLDAVNACLRGIGIAPVATEGDNDLDAAQAFQTIESVSMDIQSRGWWFNKERNWRLTPDEITGYIQAPPSALSIVTSGHSRSIGLTIRSSKIYDLYNHTFDLRDRAVSQPGSTTKFIELTFITELDFNDLPPVAKQAITYRARREFAQDMEVDEKRWKFQSNDEQFAMVALLREDSRNTKRNKLRDNAVTAAFINRVGGQNSASPMSGVYPKRTE